jgi:hypothetical protein
MLFGVAGLARASCLAWGDQFLASHKTAFGGFNVGAQQDKGALCVHGVDFFGSGDRPGADIAPKGRTAPTEIRGGNSSIHIFGIWKMFDFISNFFSSGVAGKGHTRHLCATLRGTFHTEDRACCWIDIVALFHSIQTVNPMLFSWDQVGRFAFLQNAKNECLLTMLFKRPLKIAIGVFPRAQLPAMKLPANRDIRTTANVLLVGDRVLDNVDARHSHGLSLFWLLRFAPLRLTCQRRTHFFESIHFRLIEAQRGASNPIATRRGYRLQQALPNIAINRHDRNAKFIGDFPTVQNAFWCLLISIHALIITWSLANTITQLLLYYTMFAVIMLLSYCVTVLS